MKRFIPIIAMAVCLNLSGAEPNEPKKKHSWNPFRLAKALDKKLGEVTIELSAVKSGKPVGSERKRDEKQTASSEAAQPVSQPVSGAQ